MCAARSTNFKGFRRNVEDRTSFAGGGAAGGHNPGRIALRGKIGKPFKGF
jgi:hypothetical protein